MLDDIFKRQPLLKSGVVFTYDFIDSETFPEIVASLIEAREYAKDKPVRYFITSHGGHADVGMALFDFITGFGNVHTYIFGVVESAAVSLFAAGTRRFVTPYAGIGVHPTYVNPGQNRDARSDLLSAERSKTLDDQLSTILASISNQDRNWWKQIQAKGVSEVTHVLDAAAVVQYGMAEYARPEDYIFTRPTPTPAATQPVAVSEPNSIPAGQTDTKPSAPKSAN